MVKKMAEAGFRSVFFGIENASKKNLTAAGKGDICEASRTAIANCRRTASWLLVDLSSVSPTMTRTRLLKIINSCKSIEADAAYCQILTPYPKTGMREFLSRKRVWSQYKTDYKKYSGLWANVRTRHLDADRLQYLFWYHRQQVLGWWDPSQNVTSRGMGWTGSGGFSLSR